MANISNRIQHEINSEERIVTNIEYEEYFLIKSNMIYKIMIGKNDSMIFIKCKNYIRNFDYNELSILMNMTFNSMETAYQYIINQFEDNNVIIKSIIKNKEMKFQLEKGSQNNIEIILLYDNKNRKKTK